MNPTVKRVLLILLVILLLAAIGFGIWSFLKRPKTAPAPAPTSQTQDQDVVPSPRMPLLTTSTRPAPNPESDEEQERKAREALFRRARDLVSRAGTYSSVDQFAALQQVYIDAGPEAKAFLQSERERLIAERASGSFVQTTRSLAARLAEEIPVRTATDAQVIVEAQQLVQQDTQSSTVLKRAVVTLQKSGGTWIMTRLVWEEFNY